MYITLLNIILLFTCLNSAFAADCKQAAKAKVESLSSNNIVDNVLLADEWIKFDAINIIVTTESSALGLSDSEKQNLISRLSNDIVGRDFYIVSVGELHYLVEVDGSTCLSKAPVALGALEIIED